MKILNACFLRRFRMLLLPAWCVPLSLAMSSAAQAADAGPLSPSALLQIQAMQDEKASFTPVQQKMDSQLVFALKKSRNQPIANGAVPQLRIGVTNDASGKVLVDITANVTASVLNQISQSGGTNISSFSRFNAIRALVPLDQIENIAGLADVKFVRPAVPARTRTGSVDSEGDVTHRADTARVKFRTDGTGVKVGVISDSVDFLAQAQSTGDLGLVTVLPGQSGVPGTGEGTAMLEIVADLAPGTQLYFATANGGPANFAQNILNLRSVGCDIIVDDVAYPDESPFQDGIIAQAVNAVTAEGALYFSAAGNEGNFDSGTSGTWQGDSSDGGAVGAPANGKAGNVHKFGAVNFDKITQPGEFTVLFWSDALGKSANDYDLYVLDPTGANIVGSSINVQNGTQDPFEAIFPVTFPQIGEQVVIVKATSAASRFLYTSTFRGQFAIGTSGNIFGHPNAVDAYAVAAVDVHTAFPNPFTGGAANPVEFFSSDGPRRVFYNPDGSPITPGDFSSKGGIVRRKPDITAANGVSTTLPFDSGLNPFYGTSAAAPHAAAIAALVKSYNPNLTPPEIRTILTNTSLDVMAPGIDRDSGAGIVMAYQALLAAPPPLPLPNLVIATNILSGGNGNGIIDVDECNSLDLVLTNIGAAGATSVQATLSSSTPGVTIAQKTAFYPDIPLGASGTNLVSFRVSTSPVFVCGTPIRLSLLVKSDQVTTTNALQLTTGVPGPAIRFDSSAFVPIPDNDPNGT